MADAKDWLTTHDQTEVLLSSLLSKVNEAGAEGLGLKKYEAEKQLKTAKASTQALDQLLTKMENDPPRYNVAEGEIVRRRGMITGLKTKMVSVEDALAGRSSRTKQQLFGASGKTRESDEEDLATRDMSERDLVQQTQQRRDDQDQSLANIERGVVSLKNLGNDMSTELDLQKALLDKLDHQMDKTDQAFQNNTKRIDIVEKEEGKALGCGMIMCILLLLVLIVFLASSNYPCHIFNSNKC